MVFLYSSLERDTLLQPRLTMGFSTVHMQSVRARSIIFRSVYMHRRAFWLSQRSLPMSSAKPRGSFIMYRLMDLLSGSRYHRALLKRSSSLIGTATSLSVASSAIAGSWCARCFSYTQCRVHTKPHSLNVGNAPRASVSSCPTSCRSSARSNLFPTKINGVCWSTFTRGICSWNSDSCGSKDLPGQNSSGGGGRGYRLYFFAPDP